MPVSDDLDATVPAAGTVGNRRDRLRSHPNAALAVILTCQLMVVLDANIVNIALPNIQSDLDFSPTDLSWVINAYTLAFGGFLLLGARCGDLLGRRRVFVAGITLFTVASFVGGFAGSSTVLLLARAAQGIGAAFAAPSALALLMLTFAEGQARMRAIGLYTAVSVGGSAVGLVVGGMLTEWASWRWVFFVNVPIGVLLVALAQVVLPETPTHVGRFDVAGSLTSTVGMAALVYGFVEAAAAGWSAPTTITSFAVGVILLALFVRIELTAESPITPLRLLASRNRSAALLSRLLLVAGMFGVFFFLTQFLQDVLGYSPIKTGLAFLPLTAALLLSTQLSARGIGTRINARISMVLGISASTTSILVLSQMSEDTGYLPLLLSLVLFGIGNGFAFVPLTTAALSGVAPEDSGAASGLINVMQQVGGALGLAVLVTIFGSARDDALAHPKPGLTPVEQAHHAFVVAANRSFLVAAAFLAVTLLLVAFVIRPARPAPAAAPAQPAAAN